MREQMQRAEVEAVERSRCEVGHDVVVEDRGEEGAAEELRVRDMALPQRLDALADEALHRVEESGVRQKRDRQKQREEKVVLRVLLRRASRSARPRIREMRTIAGSAARNAANDARNSGT